MYWTGDLGYRDDAGFFYFAGRNSDWLRVDGENFAAAPVEHVIWPATPTSCSPRSTRCPSADVGDEVMVALHLHDGATFDAAEFVGVPRRAVRPVAQVDAAVRAHFARVAVDRDAEGA